MQNGTINKIQLPNGNQYSLPNDKKVFIYEEDDESVNWTIATFTGTVGAIPGETDYYQLNINAAEITPTT